MPAIAGRKQEMQAKSIIYLPLTQIKICETRAKILPQRFYIQAMARRRTVHTLNYLWLAR